MPPAREPPFGPPPRLEPQADRRVSCTKARPDGSQVGHMEAKGTSPSPPCVEASEKLQKVMLYFGLR